MTGLSIPERLVQRLDDLGAALAQRGDAIALIGLGSVGVDLVGSTTTRISTSS